MILRITLDVNRKRIKASRGLSAIAEILVIIIIIRNKNSLCFYFAYVSANVSVVYTHRNVYLLLGQLLVNAVTCLSCSELCFVITVSNIMWDK